MPEGAEAEGRRAEPVRLRLCVYGRVQGVWFRGWTRDQALGLGLVGFARNRADGTVEVLAQGPRAAVWALAEACRRGPPSARVERVSTVEEAPAGDLTGFSIR